MISTVSRANSTRWAFVWGMGKPLLSSRRNPDQHKKTAHAFPLVAKRVPSSALRTPKRATCVVSKKAYGVVRVLCSTAVRRFASASPGLFYWPLQPTRFNQRAKPGFGAVRGRGRARIPRKAGLVDGLVEVWLTGRLMGDKPGKPYRTSVSAFMDTFFNQSTNNIKKKYR